MRRQRQLSYGKLRGLQQCANRDGIFSILALDHRGEMKKAFGRTDDPVGTYRRIVEFKQQIVSTLADEVTAVLLDPAYGAGPMIANGVLSHAVGLLVTLEETGYAGDSTARISRIAEGLNVAKIKRMGANAVKLLIYYHPDSPTAPAMQELLQQVAADCDTYDIALFLETLCYSVEPERKLTSEERRHVIVETARQLTPLGGDVYKVEFPLDIHAQPDEGLWAEACAELDDASSLPWVLLSAGVDHETFARQTKVACKAGASGILAGRSIWKEATGLQGENRTAFLSGQAVERARELRDLCGQYARPFSDFYTGLSTVEAWYKEYRDFS